MPYDMSPEDEFCPRLTNAQVVELAKRVENRFKSDDMADAAVMLSQLLIDPDGDFDVKDFLLSISWAMPQLLNHVGYQWATGDTLNAPEYGDDVNE